MVQRPKRPVRRSFRVEEKEVIVVGGSRSSGLMGSRDFRFRGIKSGLRGSGRMSPRRREEGEVVKLGAKM